MRLLDARLKKLEAGLGGEERPLFYVFGSSETDLSAKVAAEIGAGRIRSESPYRAVIWRGKDAPPLARWSAPSDLTDDELEDAIAALAVRVGFPVRPRGMDLLSLVAAMDSVREMATR